ncbi:MAG: hypothetical protein K5868_02505 [Lachnospiraceae bacterium]|nr:hypothetical protein [Lachnospiraceae bacterium]
MNRNIKKSKAAKYIIVSIALLLVLGVWPFGVVNRTYKTSSTATEITESNEAVEEHMLAQVFVSEGSRLDWIDIYISNDVSGNKLDFAIYDGEFNRIYHKELTAPDNVTYPGYLRINTRLDLERGIPYIYTIYGIDEGVIVGLEDHFSSTNTSLMTANYDGGEDADHNICTKMKYSVGFNTWQIVLIDLIIFLMAAGMIYGISRIDRLSNSEIKVQTVLQCIFNPIVVIVSLILLYIIFPSKTFSDNPLDIVFYYSGIIILTGLLLYVINYKRTDENDEKDITKIVLVDSIQNLLTVVSIAMIIWYCFEYMNGLYDIFHSYSARRILIWFLIMIITTYRGKDLINIFNGIWLVIGIPICYMYAKPYVGLQEEELLYKLNSWVIYAGGFVIICTVHLIVSVVRNKGIINRLYLPYAIPYFVFLASILIKANTRWWPGYLATISIILAVRLLFMDDVNKFLELLCDGILLNFIFMVVFSLMHRPYYGYIYHRYNMTYFTVTMTATHMAMVILALAVKLFIKYGRTRDKRGLIPDLALFGMAGTYEFLTLSRTGYATVLFAFFVALVFIVIVWSCKGQRIKNAAMYACSLLLSVIIMFPVTFTLTRTIPALADDPKIYDYEHCIVTIYKGTEPDNEYYMTLGRFFDVFGSKVLNIGDSAASADMIVLPESRQILLASADEEDVPVIEDEEESDASNGRMDIFKSYIEQSNFEGHDEMGAILADGEEASHAHNIYLQAIYDHGWFVGIYISLFLVISVIMGAYRSIKAGNNDYMLLAPVLTVGFIVAGMVEWIFHPCNPYGLVLFMALIPMVFNERRTGNDSK